MVFGLEYASKARIWILTFTAGSSELVSRSKVIGGGRVWPSYRKTKFWWMRKKCFFILLSSNTNEMFFHLFISKFFKTVSSKLKSTYNSTSMKFSSHMDDQPTTYQCQHFWKLLSYGTKMNQIYRKPTCSILNLTYSQHRISVHVQILLFVNISIF